MLEKQEKKIKYENKRFFYMNFNLKDRFIA